MTRPPAPGTPPDGETPLADPEQLLSQHQATLRERFPLPDLVQLHAAAQARADKRKRAQRRAAAALSCGLLAGLLWLDPAYRSETLASAPGQQRNVTLADGSTLLLDADTQAEVRWHLRSRQVTLRAGQALFDVAPSRWRPFTVAANDVRIRVTGTRFDVSLTPATAQSDAAVQVYLYEGSLRVQVAQQPDTAHTLQAGTGWRWNGHSAQLQSGPADASHAWTQGLLVFEDTPLQDAIAQLQRYVGRPLQLEDATLATRQVSGVFQIAQAHRLLELLPVLWPVEIRDEGAAGVRILPRGGR